MSCFFETCKHSIYIWLFVVPYLGQSIVSSRWFSPGPPVSSTNKTDRHDITEILLKVAWNTIKQTISFSILWRQLYNRNNFSLLICVLMPRTCLILPSAYIKFRVYIYFGSSNCMCICVGLGLGAVKICKWTYLIMRLMIFCGTLWLDILTKKE